MRTRHLGALLLLIGGTTAVACHDTTATTPDVSGNYALTVVDGEAVPQQRSLSAVSGSIVLGTDGSASRQIKYMFRQTGQEINLSAHGTFVVRSNGVQLTLFDDSTPGNPAWMPFANRSGDVLELHYAGTDTADVVEVYVRSHASNAVRRP